MTQHLVLTSINAPTPAVRRLRQHLADDWTIVVVGDRKTPVQWECEGIQFLSLSDQLALRYELAAAVSTDHYARKNIGYLWALDHDAHVIAETDDDNAPYDHFLRDVCEVLEAALILDEGWVNMYTLFTHRPVWPRGFPLEAVAESLDRDVRVAPVRPLCCPIQQYLADGDPDVDAIFRLTRAESVDFRPGRFALGAGSYAPFNSQNTIWWPAAFAYLYLPSHVTLRMTDIWRGFIAHRCLKEPDQFLGYCGPTVYQDRNRHSLITDFEDEIPGYLHNRAIVELLRAADLTGLEDTARLRRCYERLVDAGFVPSAELPLLEAWIADFHALTGN